MSTSCSSNNLNILRNPTCAIRNAFLVKLSAEIVEQVRQEARTVVDLEGCNSIASTSQGPQLAITEQGKYFYLRLHQNKSIKLKHIPENSSDIEFYEVTQVKDDSNSLVLSGKVKGKLFEEKQLSNKIAEHMKKRVLQAEKEAHAHDIKVIQPLEHKKKNGIVKQTLTGNKRRASLPPLVQKTSSEDQWKKDNDRPNRTAVNQSNSEKDHLQSANSMKNNVLPTTNKHTSVSISNSHIPAQYRDHRNYDKMRSGAYSKDRQVYASKLESSKELTNRYPPSADTSKNVMSLRTFLMYMLLLGPSSIEELERERQERFLRFESDTSLSTENVLGEIAVLQDGKWRLKEDKMASLVVNDFPLYSGEESKVAEGVLLRWKEQRKLCSEEEIHAALEAFQRELDSNEDGLEGVVSSECKDRLEGSLDEVLKKYIDKYRLYHSLVSRLNELSKSFQDLKSRFLNSSSAEERQKLRQRIKILKDKHAAKWDVSLRLVKHLERQLIDYKNKLQS